MNLVNRAENRGSGHGRLLWTSCLLAGVLLATDIGGGKSTLAGEAEESALSLVPQDAAFFSSSLNLEESWNEFVSGPFMTRLRAVPYIQEVEAELWKQWENDGGQVAQAKAVLQNPNVQNLVKLLRDMFSDEVFVYGGSDLSDTLSGVIALQGEMMNVMSEGPEAMEAYFQEMDAESLAGIKLPTLVMGFRVEDEDNARLQLDALEGFARLGGSAIEEALPFLERLKRRDFAAGQTLTFTLDASLIPVDQFQGQEAQTAAKIVEILGGRSISFGLGVKDGILLIGFSEDADVLNNFGDPEESLFDHPELEPLRSADPAKLRSIGYVSKEFSESNFKANFGSYFENLASQFSMALETEKDRIPELSEWRAEIINDAQKMDAYLGELAPEFGAMVSWSRAIPGGLEGYTYNGTKNDFLANASPMKILEHAGSQPMLVLAGKQKPSPKAFEMVDLLLDVAPKHLKRFIALAEEGEEDRRLATLAVERGFPLVTELVGILEGKIQQATAQNETLIAMDGDWSIAELPDLPPPQTALPLPEFALACGISNRDLFVAGGAEIFEVFDKALELIRELAPDAAPPGYMIPRPEESEAGAATKFSYAEFTNALPIPGFEPQGLLSDDVLILGYSSRQVVDMLAPKAMKVRPAWLKADTPVAAISMVDMAAMVEMARPWAEYGLMLSGKGLDEPLANAPGPVPNGADVLQIWDCLSSAGIAASTTTIQEDQSSVTRWIWTGE
jgi:hypothetical protein